MKTLPLLLISSFLLLVAFYVSLTCFRWHYSEIKMNVLIVNFLLQPVLLGYSTYKIPGAPDWETFLLMVNIAFFLLAVAVIYLSAGFADLQLH